MLWTLEITTSMAFQQILTFGLYNALELLEIGSHQSETILRSHHWIQIQQIV